MALTVRERETLYTSAEVADLLGANRRLVQLWIAGGRLPSYRLGNQSVVLASDLARFRRPPPRKRQSA